MILECLLSDKNFVLYDGQLSQTGPISQKIPHFFFENTHKQTDKPTNRQTDKH